ncbi:hypothetical protein [uncultured Aquitalea sp.]|uniref:hypothetical protein n=1 Tax=uncultured Aquitalea sp. TaxID=540272 RepID=UPI0025DAEC84|nr:hypothetical protein [uncultured Aquitalea sp.]
MDILHSTWFWVAVIVGLAVSTIGTLARLSRQEGPIELPPGVKPQAWDDDKDEDEQAEDEAGHVPPSLRKPH